MSERDITTMGRNELIERIEELENKIKKWCKEQCPAINSINSNIDCKKHCILFKEND